MTREELIEVVARAILRDYEDGADMSTHPVPERAATRHALAALAALEAAGARLVPSEATKEREMSKDEGAVTVEQMQTLTLFKNPLTYAVEMSREDAKPLVDMGLLEWLPPMWGNTPNYGITEAGRALLTARDAQ